MKEKVFIEIEKGKYDKSVKNGSEYIGVGFSAKNYGQSSPCDNEKEVKETIKSCEDNILKEGDIPIIRDLRIKQQTLI